MPEYICNTSPLQYLHQLKRLDFLPILTGGIIIPNAVAIEIDTGITAGWNLPDVRRLPWASIREPVSAPALPLAGHLGFGEAAVLALALETRNSVVILDDLVGRRAAALLQLKMTGTLGVLIDAKKRGLISAVAPLLDQLTRLGFRVSAQTRLAVLKIALEV